MKNNGEITRVCVTNNLYVLLQYLLISTDDDIDSTFFFFCSNIPSNVVGSFVNCKRFVMPKAGVIRHIYRFYLHLFSRYKYPFLNTAEFWGQDNISISSPLVGDRKMIILEDGLMNYTFKPRSESKFIRRIKKILFGNLSFYDHMGYSEMVDKVYLTGLRPIPNGIKEKVVKLNLHDLWNRSSFDKQNMILNIFGLTLDMINHMKKYDNILFTQPLSEDGIISESEKIEIYSAIIKNIKGGVLIKSHPREISNYKKYFPDCYVFDIPIPFELLSLIGVRFTSVYTLFSTAAYNLPYNCNVNIIGTKIHPKLYSKLGDVS